ncbi:MAG TPA: 4'-phosphopantetheinyl transferase superfamily protein [Solirubrobacteraceae bacterium]|nr:4'-phosphopantetheinyl transferase superfamily protein [Solirubrobacteraceae bacterium]
MRIDAKPRLKAPPLADGDVHVWVTRLTPTDFDSTPGPLLGLLDAEERQRAARFHRRRDGVRWACSRALLRLLLAGYLDRDPATLRFALGKYGKPEIPPPSPPSANELSDPCPQLHFNLSHSGAFALYAIALDQPVGVDIEALDRDVDQLAVAARAFDGDSVRRLRELPPAERKREFVRLWVRHEASLKCLGLGLGSTEALAQPWVAELDVADGMLAAVAARREPTTLVCNSF